MPKNKKHFERLLVINELLNSRRRFTWQQLADACESKNGSPVSERTIKDDIRVLREEHDAPLLRYNRGGYQYSEACKLFQMFDDEDAELLNQVRVLLQQFSILPQVDIVEEMMARFKKEAGYQVEPIQNVVFFEQNLNLKGRDYLYQLYNFIIHQKCVQITYTSFEKVTTEHVFHPYFLKEYNNRWYLFGLEHTNQKIYNLSLDRITKLADVKDIVYIPDRYELARLYFKNIVGVTNKEEDTVEKIVLRCFKPRANYLQTKPLHSTQSKVNETDSFIDFSYSLKNNPELETKILEFGSDMEVLEPSHLRKQIKSKIQRMLDLYEGD